MAVTRDQDFKMLSKRFVDKSRSRSSNGPTPRKVSRYCQSDGSSNELSPGSIDVAVSPRIGNASTKTHWPSYDGLQSGSCSEGSVRKQYDFGQTLRVFPFPMIVPVLFTGLLKFISQLPSLLSNNPLLAIPTFS